MPKAPTVGDEWFEAIKTKSTRVIAQILEKQPELVNYKNDENTTSLMWAAIKDKTQVVKLLIDAGADIDSRGYLDKTALIWAVQFNHIQVVKLLIDAGADLEVANCLGWTALIWAIEKKSEKVAKLLIDAGADIKVLDKYGETLLTNAARSGNIPFAKLLIEKGADVNVVPIHDTRSPLSRAVFVDHYDMVKLLIENGADVNAKAFGRDDSTCLMHTGWNAESARIAKLLIENGADVNHITSDDETPLTARIRSGDLYGTKFMIELGANVNLRNSRGRTPLMEASIEAEEYQIVALLIANGADLNAVDEDSRSPLIHAAMHARPLAARVLLGGGEADIDARDNENKTAMDYATIIRDDPGKIYGSRLAQETLEQVKRDAEHMYMVLKSMQDILDGHESSEDFQSDSYMSDSSMSDCDDEPFALAASKIDLLGTDELPILLKKESSCVTINW